MKSTCKPRKGLKSTCKTRRGLKLFASLFALRVIVPVIHIETEFTDLISSPGPFAWGRGKMAARFKMATANGLVQYILTSFHKGHSIPPFLNLAAILPRHLANGPEDEVLSSFILLVRYYLV